MTIAQRLAGEKRRTEELAPLRPTSGPTYWFTMCPVCEQPWPFHHAVCPRAGAPLRTELPLPNPEER